MKPLPDDDLLELYYYLRLNRVLEDRLVALYRQSIITATVFTSRGQEAISVGSAYALEAGDYVSPLSRNLGTMLVRGMTPRDVFTQYMGKATSPTRGRERIHYFGDLRRGVVASLSVLGGMIPVMVGVGLASRLQGKTSVAMTYIGDGATSTGDFHEGLNFASVRKVPFVLIIENNRFGYSTPVEATSPVPDLARRAAAYGIEAEIVDGNDVLSVYGATRRALMHARAGRGPAVIEAKTMRMHGHSDADRMSYVPASLLAEWQARDPILRYEKQLAGWGLLDPARKQAIEARIATCIEADLEFALQSPDPPGEAALGGVYACWVEGSRRPDVIE